MREPDAAALGERADTMIRTLGSISAEPNRLVRLFLTPEHRAAANVWFLHHGRQALCLCLGLGGTVELFRYRPLLGTWSTC